MAGNEKDHWLQNARANDTGSIVEGYSRFIQSAVRRPIYGLPPDYSTYYRSCVYVLLRFSTLRRNHHWVCWLPSIRPVTPATGMRERLILLSRNFLLCSNACTCTYPFSWQTLFTASSWNHHVGVQTMSFLAKIFVVLLSSGVNVYLPRHVYVSTCVPVLVSVKCS
jgi:hypothetical protein